MNTTLKTKAFESPAAVESLQATLTSMIDLSLQLKQVHWNIVGAGFLSLHEQLDDIYKFVTDSVDEIAERVRALGKFPDGGVSAVAENSDLEPIPTGKIHVDNGIEFISDRLLAVTSRMRQALEELNDDDPITVDLFVRVCGQLEKFRWLVVSQR